MPDRAATCNELQQLELESEGAKLSATSDWPNKTKGTDFRL